jgi:hypothetical protein
MDEKQSEQKGDGCVVSVWMPKAMLVSLGEKAKGIRRSRSWMICELLREPLGVPPEDNSKRNL